MHPVKAIKVLVGMLCSAILMAGPIGVIIQNASLPHSPASVFGSLESGLVIGAGVSLAVLILINVGHQAAR